MKKITAYEAPRTEGLLLNANESSSNLSEKIMDEICEAVRQIPFNRYPDPSQKELLEAYARVSGLNEAQLLAGNGSDQMLGYVICYYLGHGKKLYTFSPDFSMYDYYASSYEAETIKFRLAEDGKADITEFIRQGKENDVDMIMFSNPNNPTGHCLCPDEIRAVLEAFRNIPVVVDEAYMDFAQQDSALTLLDEYSNLYVTRTLSKACGLAGIRLGFLISSKENMAELKGAFVPYALNSFTMKAGTIALSHAKETAVLVRNVIAERERVFGIVKDMKKLKIYPSEANFLYGKSDQKDRLMEMMKEENIIIRNYAGTKNFRITIGKKEENDKVLEVLKRFEEAE